MPSFLLTPGLDCMQFHFTKLSIQSGHLLSNTSVTLPLHPGLVLWVHFFLQYKTCSLQFCPAGHLLNYKVFTKFSVLLPHPDNHPTQVTGGLAPLLSASRCTASPTLSRHHGRVRQAPQHGHQVDGKRPKQ